MPSSLRRGALITFSGVDCSGKSTQLEHIDTTLRREGIEVVRIWNRVGYTHWFQSLKNGVRTLRPSALPKKGNSYGRHKELANPRTRTAWFAAAAVDLTRLYTLTIGRHLARGAVVLCDRYLADSHVDLRLHFPEADLPRTRLWRWVVALAPKPDLSLYFDVPLDVALDRAEQKREVYRQPDELVAQRIDAYREANRHYEHHCVDGNRARETIAHEIERLVRDSNRKQRPLRPIPRRDHLVNIKLQMQRENFPEIFCETLKHFLRWRDDRDYRVSWNHSTAPRGATLFVHPRLGIATPQWADPRNLAFVWRELRSGKNVLDSLARRLYLAAHLAPGPTRPLLASDTVSIDPAPSRFNDGFYVPGGNQLRWFEPAKSRCTVCVKRGFPDHYFRAQVDVRSNFDVPAPRLLAVDHGALIFSEEIVNGQTRINASPRKRAALASRALAALVPLAEASSQSTTTRHYAEQLVSDIAANAAMLPPPIRHRTSRAAQSLLAQLADRPLQTVIAHGDLTFGHILDVGDRVILVDWEHSARRQRKHDQLTLELRPQLPQQFFERLGRGPYPFEIVLLLLEGLELATRESNNAAFTTQPAGLLAVLDGLETSLAGSGMVAPP